MRRNEIFFLLIFIFIVSSLAPSESFAGKGGVGNRHNIWNLAEADNISGAIIVWLASIAPIPLMLWQAEDEVSATVVLYFFMGLLGLAQFPRYHHFLNRREPQLPVAVVPNILPQNGDEALFEYVQRFSRWPDNIPRPATVYQTDQCVICRDEAPELSWVIGGCGHPFHYECISHVHRCPVCRAHIEVLVDIPVEEALVPEEEREPEESDDSEMDTRADENDDLESGRFSEI